MLTTIATPGNPTTCFPRGLTQQLLADRLPTRLSDLEAHVEYYRVLADEAINAGSLWSDESGSLLTRCRHLRTDCMGDGFSKLVLS